MTDFATFDDAKTDDGIDKDVACYYHNPLDEQLTLALGAGLVDLSNRDIVTVSGPDRLSWLTTLSSQIVDTLAPGQSKELLLLDAQGRIAHQAGIIDNGTVAYLLTDVGRGAALAAFLDSMRFMLRVEVAHVDNLAQVGYVRGGPIEQCAFDDGIIGVWNDPWPGIDQGGTTYCRNIMPDKTRFAIAIVKRDSLADIIASWLNHAQKETSWPVESEDGERIDQVNLVGMMAWEALRIAAWRPRLSLDVDEKTVPHEWDWLRTAVHLHKGCYCGQETVARIVNLGRPPRRAIFLTIDGSDNELPSIGDEVVIGSRVWGVITSVAFHYQEGIIALALVRRAMPHDADVQVRIKGTDDVHVVSANVTQIVNADGKAQESPQERPGMGMKRLPGSPGSMIGSGGLGM